MLNACWKLSMDMFILNRHLRASGGVLCPARRLACVDELDPKKSPAKLCRKAGVESGGVCQVDP